VILLTSLAQLALPALALAPAIKPFTFLVDLLTQQPCFQVLYAKKLEIRKLCMMIILTIVLNVTQVRLVRIFRNMEVAKNEMRMGWDKEMGTLRALWDAQWL